MLLKDLHSIQNSFLFSTLPCTLYIKYLWKLSELEGLESLSQNYVFMGEQSVTTEWKWLQ